MDRARISILAMGMVVVGGLSLAVWADAPGAAGTESGKSAPAATQPASADQVMKDMSGQIQENPMIEPKQRPAVESVGVTGGNAPAVKLDMDHKVLGVAPGMPQPKLRREGEFIVSRRGRLVRASNGMNLLFVFEADSEHAAEPPMGLVPCRKLQDMEDFVQERGDKLVFVVTGEVLTYRGSNYLLPTMAMPDLDRGNLQR